jgi:septum formation protein
VQKLILASTSTYRKNLMQRLQLPFVAVAPEVDERAFPTEGLAPSQIATALAKAKADAVFHRNKDAVVIGSDQLVSLDGEIFGKPGNQAAAVDQLRRLSGRRHELVTAVYIVSAKDSMAYLDTSELEMRELNQEEILRYIRRDNPVDCAGAYKIEKLGPTLLKNIRNSDPTAIEGLPLIAVADMLRKFGYALP